MSNELPWHSWGCMAIAFMIPFAKKFVPGFILLLGLYSIIYFIRKRKLNIPSTPLPFILLSLIFLLHVIGLYFSIDTESALNEIGIKLSYLAFPVIGILMPPLQKKDVNNIIQSFIWGCIAFIPLAITYGIYRSIHYNNFAYLTYQKLGIYLHPTYAATYEAMAFFIMMRQASKGRFFMNKIWIHYLIGAIILIFISLLASKAGLIAALISIFMGGWCWLKNKNSIKRALVVTTSSLLMLIGSIMLAPGLSDRVDAAVHDVTENEIQEDEILLQNQEAKSSTSLRFVTWQAAFDVFKEHPFGVGTGNTESALVAKYETLGESAAAHKKLNAHNQFLQAGAEHGWPGILLLTLTLLVLYVYATRWKYIIMLHFILLVGMNFLFESFLEVQAGIVFFCFWVMVFVKTGTKANKVEMGKEKNNL